MWVGLIAIIAIQLTGLAVAQPQTSEARSCSLLSGTADGFTKSKAIERSREALSDYVIEFKKTKHLKKVSITPAKAPVNPYWRSKVTPTLYLKPDLRTNTAYTICWEGVISPAVCTSGAKICG